MNEYKVVGEGFPIVCLHGNGENNHEFDELVQSIENYQFILINARYNNKSDSTKQYHYAMLEEDVLEVVEHLQLQKYGIIGFSDGGIEGIEIASKDERVSFLITLGASTHPKAIKPMIYYTFKLQYFFLCILSLYHPIARKKKRLYKLMLKEPRIDAQILSRIQAPTLILTGEYDLVKLSDSQFIHEHIPHSALKVIKGGNHFLLQESFKETLKEIKLFLNAYKKS